MSRPVVTQAQIAFGQLRSGDLFQLAPDGVVFIRCRGGFREGRGGQLHACSANVPVARYTAHDIEAVTDIGREVQA